LDTESSELEYGNEVSVYYPMDKKEYNSKISRNNVKWLRHGDKTLLGIAKASVDYGKDEHPHMILFR
jgi:hypothetical protein